jgi:hypothetical protein
VREWGQLLMKNYQLLHAVERPMNLDYAKAFANTSDLKQFTPKIDHNLAADRAEERLAEDGK